MSLVNKRFKSELEHLFSDLNKILINYFNFLILIYFF